MTAKSPNSNPLDPYQSTFPGLVNTNRSFRNAFIGAGFVILGLVGFAILIGRDVSLPGGTHIGGNEPNPVPTTSDTVKPIQENIQKIEPGGNGFQNNGNNFGNQAVNMKVYSSNLFISLSDPIREITQKRLEKLKVNYPNAPTIKFINQGAGPATGQVIRELQPITQSAGYNIIPDDPSNSYGNGGETPVRIALGSGDTTFAKDYINAISPFIKFKYRFHIAGGNFGGIILLHIQGSPWFDRNGAVVLQ